MLWANDYKTGDFIKIAFFLSIDVLTIFPKDKNMLKESIWDWSHPNFWPAAYRYVFTPNTNTQARIVRANGLAHAHAPVHTPVHEPVQKTPELAHADATVLRGTDYLHMFPQHAAREPAHLALTTVLHITSHSGEEQRNHQRAIPNMPWVYRAGHFEN